MPIASGVILPGLPGNVIVVGAGIIAVLRHLPRALTALAFITGALALAIFGTRNMAVDGNSMRTRIAEELRDHRDVPLYVGR